MASEIADSVMPAGTDVIILLRRNGDGTATIHMYRSASAFVLPEAVVEAMVGGGANLAELYGDELLHVPETPDAT